MKKYLGLTVILCVFLSVMPAMAIPTLQVWSPNWTSVGDSGSDEDTWFVSGSPFSLSVIGDGPQTNDITNLRLIASVPEGQLGSISGLGAGTSFTTIAGIVASLPTPPSYSPPPPPHYPFKDDVSDFLVFSLPDMTGSKVPVSDYNADGGTITPGGEGWIQTLNNITFSGFTSLHFDVIGIVDFATGAPTKWDINPFSHDVSTSNGTNGVPEPGTILLLGGGLLGLWGFKRKFSK